MVNYYDKILEVSYPLSLEPYSKMLVSIMAKKVATGITHLVIDMPVGPTTKIPDMNIAQELKKKFNVSPLALKLDVTNKKSIKNMVEKILKKK